MNVNNRARLPIRSRVIECGIEWVGGILQREGVGLDLFKLRFYIWLMVKGHLLIGRIDPGKNIVFGIVAPQCNVVIEDIDLPLTVCQADTMDGASHNWKPSPLM